MSLSASSTKTQKGRAIGGHAGFYLLALATGSVGTFGFSNMKQGSDLGLAVFCQFYS